MDLNCASQLTPKRTHAIASTPSTTTPATTSFRDRMLVACEEANIAAVYHRLGRKRLQGREALAGGVAPSVFLESTYKKALECVSIEELQAKCSRLKSLHVYF
jgi:hypothetical protein